MTANNKCPYPQDGPGVSKEALITAEDAINEARRCLGLHVCQSCDLCRFFCPDLCITKNDAGSLFIDYNYCKGCGICAAVCPKNAIKMVTDVDLENKTMQPVLFEVK
jgi:2-oxoacid:acceptor oxidoreductase delta subunit (pyruvate/2-ketoisovalerate family)